MSGNIQVHLLDADAVAMEAAKLNVPDAASFTVGNGWHGVESSDLFDMVVSNPPVHRGVPDDFTVVQGLIEGAPQHLTADGEVGRVVGGLVGQRCSLLTAATPNTALHRRAEHCACRLDARDCVQACW